MFWHPFEFRGCFQTKLFSFGLCESGMGFCSLHKEKLGQPVIPQFLEQQPTITYLEREEDAEQGKTADIQLLLNLLEIKNERLISFQCENIS